MANSNSEGTGSIIFKGEAKLTKVIRAVFGHFGFSPQENCSPQEYYVTSMSWDSTPTWESIYESVAEQFDVELIEREDGFRTDWKATLLEVGKKIGGEGEKFLIRLAEELNPNSVDESVNIEDAFDFAMGCEDGHNLDSLEFETAWTCDKPRNGEFGGAGVFANASLTLCVTSNQAVSLGRAVAATMESTSKENSDNLAKQINSILFWSINDAKLKASVIKEVAKALEKLAEEQEEVTQ